MPQPLPNYFYPSKEKTVRLREIPGYERYSVTDDGRIISFVNPDRPIVLRTHPNKPGYHIVCIRGTAEWGESDDFLGQFLVHRLVAEAFVKNPNPKLYDSVHHKDWNKNNNHWTNLAWHSMDYIREHGVAQDKWGYARISLNLTRVSYLDDQQVREIRNKWALLPPTLPRTNARGAQVRKLAKEYRVSYAVIADLISGHSYKRIA